jgi:hypothetical protein
MFSVRGNWDDDALTAYFARQDDPLAKPSFAYTGP